MKARFGPAGDSDSFVKPEYKSKLDLAKYLGKFGLTAYEYQCGRGVRINENFYGPFSALVKENDIALSLHAPYFISLSSVSEETRQKSVAWLVESVAACKRLGGSRVIVHTGSVSDMTREEALALAKDTVTKTKAAMKEQGLDDITLCPETMGKVNQLGTLEETLALSLVSDNMIPCIDFGHLNARTFGGIKTAADYEKIFDTMENLIGIDRTKLFHSHFSKIEYTIPGGEKRHLTFEDDQFGPAFEPLMNIVARKGYTPTFICESSGAQAEDAARMMNAYEKARMGESK